MNLLDHGYLELVDHWGSEERIIEAARMSTAKGFKGWEEDERLLQYLYKNKHLTPFEMAGATFEVKAPIMTFREWMRHRVPFGYNEMSARYVPLPDENYLPSILDIEQRAQHAATTKNRQAQGAGANVPSRMEIASWLVDLEQAYQTAQACYQRGLDLGIPKEIARLPVPVARYSRMRVTSNLRGWLGFLQLRNSENAQKEIRVYAEGVQETLASIFPRTIGLFKVYGY